MTEEVKPTPGPWGVCNNGNCPCMIVSCPDFPIAKVTSGDWGDEYPAIRLTDDPSMLAKAEAYLERSIYGHVDENEARANARLIAAAPDLLAALKQSLPMLHWANIHGSRCDEEIAAVETALAKAEGHTP